MNASRTQFEPIAIVGRACRLPGANDLGAYWDMIEAGRCAQRALPPERLDRDLLFHPERGRQGSTYADFACLVDYPDTTSPTCRLPWSIKRHPERTYATLAAVAMDAVDDAGLDPGDLPNRNVGVYIGHTRASGLSGDIAFANYIGEISEMVRRVPKWNSQLCDRLTAIQKRLVAEVRGVYPHRSDAPLGASCSAKAVSDALMATGPYMAFNAACASSTQAIIQAVRALQLNRIDFAIAGGGSYCHSDTLVLFSMAQSLSSSGTRPWDADADGLVLGEGYATLMLCRLSDAHRHGLVVHGIVRGIGLSSDGKGKSLWAPRKDGQVLAIERAYGDTIAKADVGYIEAHATSTKLGDATEIDALAESYRRALPAGQRIPIGSVKANIGHTLETAGIAGVLKCLLAMERQTIPAVRHITTPNPKIDWQNLPFELPQHSRPWHPSQRGWIAGINAFGIGGLNTHLVVQRPLDSKTSVFVGGPTIEPNANQDAGMNGSVSERRERVAIVGVGSILAGSPNAEVFWERMRKGESAIKPIQPERWSETAYPLRCNTNNRQSNGKAEPGVPATLPVRSRLGGVIEDYVCDWRKAKIPPKQIAHASPLQFMILDAVEEAWTRSGIELTDDNRKRTGVVTGTTFGGEFSNQLQMGLRLPELRHRLGKQLSELGIDEQQQVDLLDAFAEQLLKEMPALLDETGSFTSSSLASRITKNFNLMGGATAVDSGNGSVGAALTCSVDQLLAGDNDMMICVGAQQDLGPSRYVGMTNAGILGDETGNHGIYPGEGCVVLILERESDALRHGHCILAIIDAVTTGYDSTSLIHSQQLAGQRAEIATKRQDNTALAERTAPALIETTSSGNRDRDNQQTLALQWLLRDCNPVNENSAVCSSTSRIHDASRLVGNLAGGSMAVNLLAALDPAGCNVSGSRLDSLQIDSQQNVLADESRWIFGGGASENIYEVILRKPRA